MLSKLSTCKKNQLILINKKTCKKINTFSIIYCWRIETKSKYHIE